MSTADEIARTALEILEKEGPEAVSMRRVAKAVKITPMAIYHHFPNREALLNTVVDREFSAFQEELRRRERRGGSHESILLHSMDAYVEYAFRRPRIFDYVFSQPRENARQYPEGFRSGQSPSLSAIAAIAERAIKDGFLRKADIWEVALALWAHVHGFVTLYRAGRFNLSQKDFHALVHRSTKLLIHGLAHN